MLIQIEGGSLIGVYADQHIGECLVVDEDSKEVGEIWAQPVEVEELPAGAWLEAVKEALEPEDEQVGRESEQLERRWEVKQ